MSFSTRRKPLSNNTDFNTGKNFIATSKNNNSNLENRNIEFISKRSNVSNNTNNTNNSTELPSSSSTSSISSNVPKNGANLSKMNNRSNTEESEKKKKSSPQIIPKKTRKAKKVTNNNDTKIKEENSFVGDPSTKHEKECFLNHNETPKNADSSSNNGPPRKGIRPVERERMRDWLCRHLNATSIRGLYWLEKTKLIFRIPWKHGSSQNWTEDDAELFVEWAKHTGRYYPDTDKNKGKLNTKRFKATFRCALNSLPDCRELSNLNNKAGSNAFKVYQFSCDKDTCPFKKKKSTKATAAFCDKSIECSEEETSNREETLVNDESPTSDSSVDCTPTCENVSDSEPCQPKSSFDDLTISENDVANTLLELQRGTVSRLIKEKGLSPVQQPQVIPTPPPQPQFLPVTQLPVSHMLQPQGPVPPQSSEQIYSQPVLQPQLAQPVLQPQMQSVQVLQSQLTHREIHPMTQSVTYEQTSTMTVAHPVSSNMPSVIPFVPAVVLPYTPTSSHSEPQMAKVCMIPALVPSSAAQMMSIHSNTFDSSTPHLVSVAAAPQRFPAAAPPNLPSPASPKLPSPASPKLPSPASSRLPSPAPQRAPATLSPRVPATLSPRVPATLSPRVPATLSPRAPATLSPRGPATLPPRGPATLPPRGPATLPPRAPATLPPRAPATLPPRVPATLPPRVPATLPPRVPATLPPRVPATLPSRAPSITPPKALSITPPKAPSITPPRAPSIAPPRAPSAAPPRAPSAAPPKAPSAAPPKAPSAAPPKAPSAAPPKAPSAAPPRASATAPPKTPAIAPPRALTTVPPRVSTTLPPKAPTTALPRVPSALPPRVPVTTPTSLPATTPPTLSHSASPRLPVAVPTSLSVAAPPTLPTAPQALPGAPFNVSLSETPVFNIKQEIVDATYPQLEINNNNSTTHNNNIAVKLENVLTGDLTSRYKVSTPQLKKDNLSSRNFTDSNQLQSIDSNQKRIKAKRTAPGSLHGPISRVQVTSSAQNYLKKRKK